jgi:hypothetical protein
VLLRDLSSDEEQPSLGWASAASLAQQALLYGRLVPVEGTVPQAFALPPVAVDQRCAARVLRARRRRSGPQERLRAVARSRRREVGAPERPA